MIVVRCNTIAPSMPPTCSPCAPIFFFSKPGDISAPSFAGNDASIFSRNKTVCTEEGKGARAFPIDQYCLIELSRWSKDPGRYETSSMAVGEVTSQPRFFDQSDFLLKNRLIGKLRAPFSLLSADVSRQILARSFHRHKFRCHEQGGLEKVEFEI